MLTALVPSSTFAQTPTPTPTEAPATLHIRIEEEVASAYNATARLNTTATGRVIVNNTENRTLTNVIVRLNATTATDLPIENAIPVGELPPGERVIKEYNLTTQPRLSLSHDWRSVTYTEAVEGLFQAGNISPVARAVALDPHRLLFGRNNTLEFNVTVANLGTTDLANVTLTDLLPDATVNGSLAAVSAPSNETDPYGGPLTYDNASDSLTIPTLRNGTSTTLTLRATVPASNLTDPGVDFFDMRHETRAYYTVRTEFTQEPTAGVTPVQERLLEAAKLEQAVVEQATLQQAFETPELLEIVDLLDVATNLPGELNETVFEKARALGIPVDTNLTFAAELESQAQNRSGAVLSLMDHTLNYTRDRFGAFAESRAQLAAAVIKEGKSTQSLLRRFCTI
ncbi:MAG: hypothetical protein QXT68_10095 [Halobacteria archaeon]